MRTGLLLCAALLAVSLQVGAQVFHDPFDYRPGFLSGPWQVDSGMWIATGTTAQADPTPVRQYATLRNFVLQDCVVECRVLFDSTVLSTVQRGGLVVRANAPGWGRDLVILELLNTHPTIRTGFDTFMIGEFPASPTSPGGAVGWVVPPHFLQARLRFTAVDRRLKAEVDIDENGRWDRSFETFATHVPVQTGALGLHGVGGVQIDDFKLFDGVLVDSLTSPLPRLGATVELALRAFPGAAYQAAASFGNAGIALPGGRIPLAVDPLLLGSAGGALGAVFRDFAGRLDAAGNAAVRIAIPPDPALVGLTVHVAFIAYAQRYILNFSNDLALTIES
ncbi:MAG: hypothetical protein JXQ29_06680 [Planctomycetes bacterium]|nr:hypothetical protein [Planctomycetota bacterium]